ncbi:hypothetical protein MBANPS3_010813 [Mucor bainieri]
MERVYTIISDSSADSGNLTSVSQKQLNLWVNPEQVGVQHRISHLVFFHIRRYTIFGSMFKNLMNSGVGKTTDRSLRSRCWGGLLRGSSNSREGQTLLAEDARGNVIGRPSHTSNERRMPIDLGGTSLIVQVCMHIEIHSDPIVLLSTRVVSQHVQQSSKLESDS